jgi:hypothetical protein
MAEYSVHALNSASSFCAFMQHTIMVVHGKNRKAVSALGRGGVKTKKAYRFLQEKHI